MQVVAGMGDPGCLEAAGLGASELEAGGPWRRGTRSCRPLAPRDWRLQAHVQRIWRPQGEALEPGAFEERRQKACRIQPWREEGAGRSWKRGGSPCEAGSL